MSLTDMQEHEMRQRTYDWIDTQLAARRQRQRRARRRARIRRCAHWCNPLRQVVSDVGRQP